MHFVTHHLGFGSCLIVHLIKEQKINIKEHYKPMDGTGGIAFQCNRVPSYENQHVSNETLHYCSSFVMLCRQNIRT